MAILNKILSFLIFVLAVVALVFGYLLFQRRVELRGRGEKLANTVAEVVRELDTKSGTNVASKLHREAIPGPDGGMMEGGTLGWGYYHTLRDPTTKTYDEFDKLMGEFKTQARDVRAQRDALGEAIVVMAGIMDKGDVDADAVTNVVDKAYEEPVNAVKEHLQQVHARDEAVFSKIEESALTIGHPMGKDSLKDLANYEIPLSDYVKNVRGLHTRAGNYADTLAQAVNIIDEHSFAANPDRLKDEDGYTGELETLLKDYANINETLKEHERMKVELEETRDQLEKHITALEDANENISRLEVRVANVEADLEAANQKLAATRPDGEQEGKFTELEGHVVHVNYDWNYFIIDLGARDELLPNISVLIARDREFICKARVTQVLQSYSIAEILPEQKIGTVMEGDRVVF